jgi:hypothetical protein
MWWVREYAGAGNLNTGLDEYSKREVGGSSGGVWGQQPGIDLQKQHLFVNGRVLTWR